MNKLNPKIEITNHFDNLINRIDIDIEQSIKNYKEDQILGELECFSAENRNIYDFYDFKFEFSDSDESNKSEEVIEWSESTKVIDYLNKIRQRTIDELKKAQEDSLEYLNELKVESKNVEELKSRLFADKFYFQVLYKPFEGRNKDPWIFSLFTIVLDFYMSPSDIKFLENFINLEKKTFYNLFSEYTLNLDEKFVFANSFAQNFCENLHTQYPSHVISFRKRDLMNIKAIQNPNFIVSKLYCMYNLSTVNFSCSLPKLECLDLYFSNGVNYLDQVRLENVSTLKSLSLRLQSIEGSSFDNIFQLRKLTLYINSRKINDDLMKKLFEMCPNIEELILGGDFSNLNLDRFVNLKKLELCGNQSDDFNYGLFENICNQLVELRIGLGNIDNESIKKLLNGYYFPNILTLTIGFSEITRLEKKIFDGFPTLQTLFVHDNRPLRTIDKDAFSSLKNLRLLGIIRNYKLSELNHELFSSLGNLEKLNLEENNLTRFDLKIMDYVINIKKISLCDNRIENEKEISEHFKESKIVFSI